MNRLPGVPKWSIGPPLQQEKLQSGVEAANNIGIDRV
jgi:hypothetical protein